MGYTRDICKFIFFLWLSDLSEELHFGDSLDSRGFGLCTVMSIPCTIVKRLINLLFHRIISCEYSFSLSGVNCE